jgi:hypothetical protein
VSVAQCCLIFTHPFSENKNSYLSLESWNKNDAMFLTIIHRPYVLLLSGGVSFFSTPSPSQFRQFQTSSSLLRFNLFFSPVVFQSGQLGGQ